MPLEAPLWPRIAARSIDMALALLVLYLVTRLVPAERVLARLLLGLGLLTASEALFVQYLRATPGKLATALRVAPIDRTDIDPVMAWERAATSTVGTLALILVPSAVLMMVDSAFGLLVGGTVVAVAGGYVLLVLASPLRRGAADRIADTIVVPHDAPALITRAQVEPEGESGRPRAVTAWGPVASPDARRRARAARLDDSPALVVGLVVVLLAWTFGGAVIALPLFAGWLVLFVVDETWRIARDGSTSGHRREGLVVVDERTGEPPERSRALARAIVLAVFWFFPPLLPVLALSIQLGRSGRGPHDLVAGTVVVEVGEPT